MNKSGKIEDIRKIYTHPQVRGAVPAVAREEPARRPDLDAPSTARAAEMARTIPRHRRHCQRDGLASSTASRSWPRRSRTTRTTSRGSSSSPRSRRGRPAATRPRSCSPSRTRSARCTTCWRPLPRAGINLNRLDARPSGRKVWDYVFFLDMEGHIEDEKVAAGHRAPAAGLHVPEGAGVVSEKQSVKNCGVEFSSSRQSTAFD